MKKLTKLICTSIVIVLVTLVGVGHFYYKNTFYFFRGQVGVKIIHFKEDKNNNGISDADDIVLGARKEVENKTKYKSAYYKGGYPPDDEGVCTDVIWRALKAAGIDLKSSMDEDIEENLKDYSASISKSDPNIDFRRVKNQYVYLKKYSESLTTEVIPYDKSNLIQWQRGDIVVLKNSEHIAIVSDVRRRDGVPLILHNASTYAKEEDRLLAWSKGGKIVGHFRCK